MATSGGWEADPPPAALRFIDTHCHLDRYSDPAGEVKRASAVGVVVVAVSELPSRFQREQLRYRDEPAVRAAIGIHPLAAARATAMELSLFRQLIDRTDYVGEIGLDGSQEGKCSLPQQRRVLETILSHHRITSKVLTVHSRGAEKEVVASLAEAKAPAILHWYSGPVGVIDTALQAGIYFSVNPAMLRSRSGQRLLARVPHERILTETDGPYTKCAGRPSAPADLPWIVRELAGAWSVEPEAAARQVYENMARLYSDRVKD